MQVIRLKHLLSKNSSIEYDRDAKKLSIRRQDKNFSADLTPEWKKAETLWEVIDGVKNLVDACHQIRGYWVLKIAKEVLSAKGLADSNLAQVSCYTSYTSTARKDNINGKEKINGGRNSQGGRGGQHGGPRDPTCYSYNQGNFCDGRCGFERRCNMWLENAGGRCLQYHAMYEHSM